MKNNIKSILPILLVSIGLGATIWATSPMVIGRAEPWDGGGPYYFFCLFMAGIVVGVLFYRRSIGVLFIGVIGIILGQLLYMLFFLSAGSPFLMLGVIFLLGYGVFSIPGIVLASLVSRGIVKISKKHNEDMPKVRNKVFLTLLIVFVALLTLFSLLAYLEYQITGKIGLFYLTLHRPLSLYYLPVFLMFSREIFINGIGGSGLKDLIVIFSTAIFYSAVIVLFSLPFKKKSKKPHP